MGATSTTWEDVESFAAKFPDFQLEDELPLDGGRDVMVGCTYTRRTRARDVRRAEARAEGAREQANAQPGDARAATPESG